MEAKKRKADRCQRRLIYGHFYPTGLVSDAPLLPANEAVEVAGLGRALRGSIDFGEVEAAPAIIDSGVCFLLRLYALLG